MTGKIKTSWAGSSGFTLVEVLVVMSLLSVVMLALGSALRTVAQTEERIDKRLGRADEMRVAVAFMRSTLSRISARKVPKAPPVGTGPLFAGASNSVAWVGVMPARYGAGGRYFFRLAVESDENRSALVIRFMPWVDAPVFPDWSGAQSRVLVQGITQVAMSYTDSQADIPSASTWSAADRLPDLVQIDIQTTAGPWPSLNLPMRALPTSDDRLGRASFGPE